VKRNPGSGTASNLWYFLAQMRALESPKPSSVVSAILTDVHFWIPAGMLLFGLWVLHWTR